MKKHDSVLYLTQALATVFFIFGGMTANTFFAMMMVYQAVYIYFTYKKHIKDTRSTGKNFLQTTAYALRPAILHIVIFVIFLSTASMNIYINAVNGKWVNTESAVDITVIQKDGRKESLRSIQPGNFYLDYLSKEIQIDSNDTTSIINYNTLIVSIHGHPENMLIDDKQGLEYSQDFFHNRNSFAVLSYLFFKYKNIIGPGVPQSYFDVLRNSSRGMYVVLLYFFGVVVLMFGLPLIIFRYLSKKNYQN